MASLIDIFKNFKQKVASINVFAPKKFVSPVPEKQYTPPTPQPKISFQDNVRQTLAKPIPKVLQPVANLAGRAATSPLAKTFVTPIKGLASRYQPQVNFTAEAVRQAKLVLTNPTYRKVLFNPESITPDELDSIKDIPEAKFVKPEQIKSRGKIALTGGAAGVQSLLTTKGLAHPSAAMTAGISGMLAYGLAKLSGSKDAFSDALLAVGRSPTYAGINSLTGGLQGNIANQVAGKGANFLARGLAKGAVFGIGNMIEDIAFTPILEGRPPTKQELAISGGVGLLGSVGSEALGAAFNNIKRVYSQLHPELPDTVTTKATQDFIRDELGRFVLGKGKKFEAVGSDGGKKVDLVSVSDARMIRKGLGLPENGLSVEDLPGGLQAKPIGGTKAVLEAENLYHGEGNKLQPRFEGGSAGPGKYYTDDIEIAKRYGDKIETLSPTLKSIMNEPDAKVLMIKNQADLQKSSDQAIQDGYKDLTTWAKDKGYDFVNIKDEGTVIDVSNIKNVADARQRLGRSTPEQAIEQTGGWETGQRKAFDRAMQDNNISEVKRLLPDVPAYYKEKFSTEISNLLNEKPPTIEFPSRQSAPNRLETGSTSNSSLADSIPKTGKMSIGNTTSEYNVGRIKVKDDKLIRQPVELSSPPLVKVLKN